MFLPGRVGYFERARMWYNGGYEVIRRIDLSGGDLPDGTPENIVRIVFEDCQTLKVQNPKTPNLSGVLGFFVLRLVAIYYHNLHNTNFEKGIP